MTGDLFSYVAPAGPRARFDGAVYSPGDDDARLTGQLLRVKGVLASGWATVQEIAALTGDPENSVAAQCRNLRKARFGGFEVPRRLRDGTKATYEYRLGAAGAHQDKPRSGYVARLQAELEEAHERIRQLEAQLRVAR